MFEAVLVSAMEKKMDAAIRRFEEQASVLRVSKLESEKRERKTQDLLAEATVRLTQTQTLLAEATLRLNNSIKENKQLKRLLMEHNPALKAVKFHL